MSDSATPPRTPMVNSPPDSSNLRRDLVSPNPELLDDPERLVSSYFFLLFCSHFDLRIHSQSLYTAALTWAAKTNLPLLLS